VLVLNKSTAVKSGMMAQPATPFPGLAIVYNAPGASVKAISPDDVNNDGNQLSHPKIRGAILFVAIRLVAP